MSIALTNKVLAMEQRQDGMATQLAEIERCLAELQDAVDVLAQKPATTKAKEGKANGRATASG